jgi:hypothetical protein
MNRLAAIFVLIPLFLLLLLALYSYTGMVTVGFSVSPVSLDCLFFTPVFGEVQKGTVATFNVTNRNCGNQNFTANTTIKVRDVRFNDLASETSSPFSLPPTDFQFSASWTADMPAGIYQAHAQTLYDSLSAEANMSFRVVTGGVISMEADEMNKTIINVSDMLEFLKEPDFVFSHLVSPLQNTGRSSLDYCRNGNTSGGTAVICGPSPLSLGQNKIYNMTLKYENVLINITFTELNASLPAAAAAEEAPGGGGGGIEPAPSPPAREVTKILMIDASLPQEVLKGFRGGTTFFSVTVENTGDVDIENLLILPVIPAGWAGFDAKIEYLKAGDRASRTLGVRIPLTEKPGIIFVPVVFITQGRTVLRGAAVLEIGEAGKRQLEIIEYSPEIQLLIDSKGQLSYLVKNTFNAPLSAIAGKLANYEDCFSIEGDEIQIIESVPAGNFFLFKWNIIAEKKAPEGISPRFPLIPPSCDVIFTVTSAEGASTLAKTRVSVVSETAALPDIFPLLTVILIAVVAILLLRSIQKKTSRKPPPPKAGKREQKKTEKEKPFFLPQ